MLIYSSHVQIFFYISTNHVCYPFDSFTLSMHLGEASIVSKSVFTSTACFTSLGMEKDVWSANQIWSSHLQVFFLVFMSFRKWKRRLLLYKPVALGWSMVVLFVATDISSQMCKLQKYNKRDKKVASFCILHFFHLTVLYLISCQIQWPQKHKDQTQVQEWTMKWEKYHYAYDLEIYNLTLCVSRVMCQILSHVMNVKKGIYCSVTQAVMMTIMTPIINNSVIIMFVVAS